MRRMSADLRTASWAVVLLWGLTAALLSACRHGRLTDMQQRLRQAALQNQTDSPLSVNGMQQLADYFARNGAPHEQAQAFYLLGRAYHEAGEAPQALQAYHDAIDHADTTATDCDYRLLGRICAQTASLFYQQLLPQHQLDELQRQYRFALLAGDTLCMLSAIEQRANAYDMLGMADSVLHIRRQLVSAYRRAGMPTEAAICAGAMAKDLIDKGLLAEAGRCIRLYEHHSGLFDAQGNIAAGRELFYSLKGRYFLGIHQYDSAEHYFRKNIRDGHAPYDREAGYQGLCQLFQRQGKTDSVAKYAVACYEVSEQGFSEAQSEELHHMQSLYNYTRNQELARQHAAEAHRNKVRLIVGAFTGLLLLLMAAGLFMGYRRRRQEAIRQLRWQYEHEQEMLEQAKYDLLRIKAEQEQASQTLIDEKAAEIATLQQRIAAHEQLHPTATPQIEESIAASPIFRRMRYYVSHPKEKPTADEWNLLHQMIDTELPHFYTTLYTGYSSLKQTDYDICILIRLYFSPSEIAILTNSSLSSITMKRIRLLQRMFHRTGKADEFDQLIRSIR